jgi:hypothetical protein
MTAAPIHSYQEDLKKFIEFLESHWGVFGPRAAVYSSR